MIKVKSSKFKPGPYTPIYNLIKQEKEFQRGYERIRPIRDEEHHLSIKDYINSLDKLHYRPTLDNLRAFEDKFGVSSFTKAVYDELIGMSPDNRIGSSIQSSSELSDELYDELDNALDSIDSSVDALRDEVEQAMDSGDEVRCRDILDKLHSIDGILTERVYDLRTKSKRGIE